MGGTFFSVRFTNWAFSNDEGYETCSTLDLRRCMLSAARSYRCRAVLSVRKMSSISSTGAGVSKQAGASGSKSPTLVMQIIIRRDLQTVRLTGSRAMGLIVQEHGWPIGPLMAQAAHAATAVLEKHKETPEVKAYLSDLDNMRKVVMEVDSIINE